MAYDCGTSKFFGCLVMPEGKSTLARHLAEGVNGQVLFAAYTGKAALVMRDKGCRAPPPSIRLIYRVESVFSLSEHPDDKTGIPRTAGGARPRWCVGRGITLNRDSALVGASLLIIDECSMVDETRP